MLCRPTWTTVSWAALAAVWCLAACRGGEAPQVAPANVVLISIDTLRADRLNSYGYQRRSISPSIDALARDGILFENHITTSPWTTPAHLSLLTSLHPSSHGVTTSFRELQTGIRRNRIFVRLADATLTLAEALGGHGYATAAFTAGITLDPKIGFDQGFAVYDTSMNKMSRAGIETMEGWLDRLPSRKPFFLFWHTFEVHAPYLQTSFLGDALPAAKARGVEAALKERARQKEQNLVPGYAVHKILKEQGVFTREVCDALYMGGVASTDRWVGQFMEALKQRGLYDRTLVVFTSDHGEELGQRSLDQIYDGHGHTLYEELVRVPLIVKLPGQLRAGERSTSVTSAVDVMPTILDVLSLTPQPDRLQGHSLRPLWEGRRESRLAFSEALGEGFEKKALREGRYKYILSIGSESVARLGRQHVPADAARELYDLEQDPEERRNLLVSPRQAEVAALAARLDAALRAHLAAPKGHAEEVELDPETIEKLKGLGYIR